MTTKTTRRVKAPPPSLQRRLWEGFKRSWPLIGLTAFVVLGTIAFFVIGNLIHEVQKAQREGRRLNCAVSKAITANPIVRIPAFQTQQQFDRQVASLRLITSLSNGVDCDATLGPVIAALPPAQRKNLKPLPQQQQAGGGGAQSPQTSGGQLPGGSRPPSQSGTGVRLGLALSLFALLVALRIAGAGGLAGVEAEAAEEAAEEVLAAERTP